MVARGQYPAVVLTGKAQKSPYVHGQDNGRVVLTAQESQVGWWATRDHSARPHTARDAWGRLIPSARADDDGHARPNPDVRHAKPRKYPPSSIAGNGVAYDSAFDEWHEARRRLAAQGIELGGHGHTMAAAVGALESRRKDSIRLRDVIEQKTRTRATRTEIELDREATRLLQQARDRGIGQRASGISRDRTLRLLSSGRNRA